MVLQQGSLTYAGAVSTLLDEGLLGTDIMTGSLDGECREALGRAGGSCVENASGGGWLVFVPKTENAETVLRLLYRCDIGCQAIDDA